MTLFTKEYGAGSPLIILHGLLGSLDNWHTLSTLYGKTRRVIAVDQRNHGRSPHSDKMTYGAMALDLLELFDRLDLSEASVLGHSMGGKTAMRLALDHPERVSDLIVVDIAPRSYPALHDEIFDALNSVDLSSTDSRQGVDSALARRIANPAIRQFLMKNLARNDAGRFFWKANIGVLERNYAELAKGIDSARPFDKPTLFVRTTHSGYLLPSDTETINRLFPQGRIANVDAGHWIHADAPREFSEVVLKFLDSGH